MAFLQGLAAHRRLAEAVDADEGEQREDAANEDDAGAAGVQVAGAGGHVCDCVRLGSVRSVGLFCTGGRFVDATPTPALPRCGLRPAGEGAVWRVFRWRMLVVMLVSVCGLVYIHVERLGVCKLVWGLSLVCVCLPPPTSTLSLASRANACRSARELFQSHRGRGQFGGRLGGGCWSCGFFVQHGVVEAVAVVVRQVQAAVAGVLAGGQVWCF